MNTSIYQNIATRTAGDIYIGVVGPVRTGKSTFIKRFMTEYIFKISYKSVIIKHKTPIKMWEAILRSDLSQKNADLEEFFLPQALDLEGRTSGG